MLVLQLVSVGRTAQMSATVMQLSLDEQCIPGCFQIEHGLLPRLYQSCRRQTQEPPHTQSDTDYHPACLSRQRNHNRSFSARAATVHTRLKQLHSSSNTFIPN